MFRRKDCCVLTKRAHLDLVPRANRHVHATTLQHSHAVNTLGSLSVRKQTCSGEKLLRSHAGSTVGSLSVCRIVHATTLLRSQAVSTLGFHSVRKEACSGEKIAALSRREHTWISLRAQTDMFHRKNCCDLALLPKIDDFYLRTPDPVSIYSQAHARPLRYRVGTRDPKPRSPRLCFTDCRSHKRTRCWGRQSMIYGKKYVAKNMWSVICGAEYSVDRKYMKNMV